MVDLGAAEAGDVTGPAKLSPTPERCINGHAEIETLRIDGNIRHVRCLYCQHCWRTATL